MKNDYSSEELLKEIYGDEDNLDPFQPKKKKAKIDPEKIKAKASQKPKQDALFSELDEEVKRRMEEGQDVNPFLAGFNFETKKANGEKIDTDKIFDSEGVEVETRHSIVRHMDKNAFIKVFPELLGKFFDLSNAGKQMLIIIFNELQKADNNDRVYLNFRNEYEFVKNGETKTIKKSTFYRGVNELKAAGIIAESANQYIFFINPNYMFNGNRMTFAKSFVM